MSETQELKACPFCGSDAGTRVYHDESLWSHDIVPHLQISCGECGAWLAIASADEDFAESYSRGEFFIRDGICVANDWSISFWASHPKWIACGDTPDQALEALIAQQALCPTCKGQGWVCENHSELPWDHPDGCNCGAGQPCETCNNFPQGIFPRLVGE